MSKKRKHNNHHSINDYINNENIGGISGGVCGAKTGHDLGWVAAEILLPGAPVLAKYAIEVGCGIGGALIGSNAGRSVGKGIDAFGRGIRHNLEEFCYF